LHGKAIESINSKMVLVTGNPNNGMMSLMVIFNFPSILTMIIEHFIVWMRTAGLPNFRKLWGKIERALEPGTYYVSIKSFVLSTTNALGGKNYFLAICYIVVGALCIVFAIIFLIAFLKKKSSRHTE
jgi:LEM3 (ligand-effect modulator 3) family / CDC50 family